MDKEPFVNQDSAIPKQASKILDPIVARCKGRPPSKRKVSKADQIVKKKLARKRTQKSSQNIDHSQEQDLYAMTAQENGNEGILGSQVAGEISTHDSTQCEHNFFWSGQDTSSFLAPFNPNLDHISEVPYYPQIINNNVTYYDFLQAQHHMNMQPLAKEMTDKPQLQKMNDQP
ncbi:hypothetical protein RIF29_27033 [Crotalaria pallida]|uniref:Uncharacterized protein n=1 Tax=Crotalaria pallida TaxID=3830 RepID=A0AAN9ENW2_CROPI